MTLLALLLVGTLAAAGTAWALPRGGDAARIAAVGGVIALGLVGVLAAASPTPNSVGADATGAVQGTLWNGAIVPNGYLRLVVVLAAASSIGACAIAWLLRGVAGLRGLLPASLAALVGMTVALGASSPQLGIVAAGATGLASIPVLLATPRAAAAGVAAREVRIAVASAMVVLAVAAVLPALPHLVLASPGADGAPAGSGIAAAVAFGLLAMTLVIAARVGAIPYHVRISALTDTAPETSLPLLLAWLPLPLAAVAVGVALGELGPLELPVGSAQALIVGLALLATLAAALAAGFQDDLRHAVGYLTLADLGLVVLAFAALDPAAWGPARTWLLTAAVTKSALAAWATVAEDRYRTRSVPELRGWLRPSPLLGVALVLIVVATYGLPGWAVATARLDLTRLAAGGPWSTLLLVASLLTLPAYVRWLWLGIEASTSHVDGAVPESLTLGAPSGRAGRLLRPPARRRGHEEGLPVEQEGDDTSRAKAVAARPVSRVVRPAVLAEPLGRSEPAAAPVPAPTPRHERVPVPETAAASSSAAEAPSAANSPAAAASPSRAASAEEAGATSPARTGAPAAGLRIRAALRGIAKPNTEIKLWSQPEAETSAPASAKPEARPARATRVDPVEPEARRATAAGQSPTAPAGEAPAAPATTPAPQSVRRAPDADSAPSTRPTFARPQTRPESPAFVEPTLFDLPEPGLTPLRDAEAPTPPALGDIRAGTGVGRRTRTPNGRSGSSPMTAPRAPEASMELPAALLASDDTSPVLAADSLDTPDAPVRPRRARVPSGPGAGTRTLDAVRRHRADLLSTAVLALALLAALVASGAFGVSTAACEPTQAVPSVSSVCG